MKSALFLILTMLSCSASAAWTEVTKNDVGDTFYIDFDTLKKDGQKRTYWQWTDFKEPIGKYYSSRLKFILDCGQETLISVSVSYFTQNGLRGESLDPEPTGKVVHVVPNTSGSTIMSKVCSK